VGKTVDVDATSFWHTQWVTANFLFLRQQQMNPSPILPATCRQPPDTQWVAAHLLLFENHRTLCARFAGNMKASALLWVAAFAVLCLVLPVHAQISRVGWTVTASSQELARVNGPVGKAIDGDATSFWHTQWVTANPAHPHTITIDMGKTNMVGGLTYLPRQDGSKNGNIGGFQIQLSADGKTFGTPVVTGTWDAAATVKAVNWPVAAARAVRLVANSPAATGPWASASEINLFGASGAGGGNVGGLGDGGGGGGGPPPNPIILSRAGFTATATSQNSAAVAPGNVLDGNRATFWDAKWSAPAAPLPHSITIAFGGSRNIAGLIILGRQDGRPNGHIGSYTIAASSGGGAFATVATGTFADARGPKTVTFAPRQATAVRITANTEAGGRGPWTTIAEVNVLGYSGAIPTANPQKFGQYSPMINMPIVPVAAALLPNGRVRSGCCISQSAHEIELKRALARD
jgi:galactose oxidase